MFNRHIKTFSLCIYYVLRKFNGSYQLSHLPATMIWYDLVMSKELEAYQSQRLTGLKTDRTRMLTAGKKIQLSEILTLPDSSVNFRPSSFAAEAEERVKLWAEKLGVWLPGISEFTNSMTAFLHPNAISLERLTLIGKFYILLFFIDDLYGNSKQRNLAESEKVSIQNQIGRLKGLLAGTMPASPYTGLEQGSIEVLQQFHSTSTPEWFSQFSKVCETHLVLAIQDQNSMALGRIHTVGSFTRIRNEIAGMHTSIALEAYARAKTIDLTQLEVYKMRHHVERAHFLIATICSYFNEFFSMEMEVIDDNDDFNLIPILMLQNEHLNLEEAIYTAADLLNDYVAEFNQLSTEIKRLMEVLFEVNDTLPHNILAHLEGMEAMINAAWFWEVMTERYQRNDSIFVEVLSGSRKKLSKAYQSNWAHK